MDMPPPPKHAPYPPRGAILGGLPNRTLDVPVTAVFLVLFIMGAATHMTIFQVNLRRGRKFIPSAMVFGFCMARVVACTMRLVWFSHPRNVSVGIASQIFVAAGVIIFFILNVLFCQRLIRASHPHLGWAKWFSLLFKIYYGIVICVLIILITAVIQTFYTLDMSILHTDRNLLLFGSTFFAVAAFLPIPLLALRALLPTRGPREDFGEGSFNTKILIILTSSTLLTLGAAFRSGTSYVSRPATNPAWYHSKACFYTFNFTIEFFVVFLYAVTRIDKRFIVPNGSHGPGDYSRPVQGIEEGKDASLRNTSGEHGTSTAADLEPGLASEKAEITHVPAGQRDTGTAPVSAVPAKELASEKTPAPVAPAAELGSERTPAPAASLSKVPAEGGEGQIRPRQSLQEMQ